MNIEQAKAFQELGLHYTADKAEVKRACSARLKTCNPQKNPEEWMELHRAFQTAMSVFTRPPSEKETYSGEPSLQEFRRAPLLMRFIHRISECISEYQKTVSCERGTFSFSFCSLERSGKEWS